MADQPEIVDIRGLAAATPARSSAWRVRSRSRARSGGCSTSQVTGSRPPSSRASRRRCASSFELPAAAKERSAARSQRVGLVRRRAHQEPPRLEEVFDYGAERPRGRAHAGAQRRREPLADGRPALREALLAHYHRCQDIARALLHALCAGLRVAPDALERRVHRSHELPAAEPLCAVLRSRRARTRRCCRARPARRAPPHRRGRAHVALPGRARRAPGAARRQLVLIEPVPVRSPVDLGDMLQVWEQRPLPLAGAPRARERRAHAALGAVLLEPVVRGHLRAAARAARARRARALPPGVVGGVPRPPLRGRLRHYGAEIQIADFRVTAAHDLHIESSTRRAHNGR